MKGGVAIKRGWRQLVTLQAPGVHVHGMAELRGWGMCPSVRKSVRGWSVISNRSELVHSLALHKLQEVFKNSINYSTTVPTSHLD
ncbi:unnamed protein product [Sphagnum jensenii]|uniref:Uncharacterized protein n=1 Tax=Sphagnum jensenii TaxID=128206 RepID=A0ABP1B6N9_9BRYO